MNIWAAWVRKRIKEGQILTNPSRIYWAYVSLGADAYESRHRCTCGVYILLNPDSETCKFVDFLRPPKAVKEMSLCETSDTKRCCRGVLPR